MAPETARRGWRLFVPVAAYVLLYIALAWLSYARPALKPEITPWNPQTGLTVTFLLVFGPRYWLVPVVAAFLSELLVSSSDVAIPLTLGACLWIGVIYGAFAVVLRRLDLADSLPG